MDHTVCHFEIPAEEPKRAAEFYRGLFDWDIRTWDSPDNKVEIMMISTVPTDETGRPARPGVNGMIMKRQHPQQPFANYISVESVDEYGAKAEDLGGQVIMPKTPCRGWAGSSTSRTPKAISSASGNPTRPRPEPGQTVASRPRGSISRWKKVKLPMNLLGGRTQGAGRGLRRPASKSDPRA